MPRAKLHSVSHNVEALVKELDKLRQCVIIQNVIMVRAPKGSVFAYDTHEVIVGTAGHKLKMVVTIDAKEIIPDEGE